MELKAKATKEHKDKHYQPHTSNTFQAVRVTQNLLNKLCHSHTPVGTQHPKCCSVQVFCQGLSFLTAENSPSFGEMNETPSKDYFLAPLSNPPQWWPFFMYFSILYEETATCLGDLKFYSLFVGYTEPSYFEDASDI